MLRGECAPPFDRVRGGLRSSSYDLAGRVVLAGTAEHEQLVDGPCEALDLAVTGLELARRLRR